MYALYIPHGSDNTIRLAPPSLKSVIFISHMVQIIPEALAEVPKLEALYIPHGSDNTWKIFVNNMFKIM